jgi:hypothetical protein
MLEALKAEADSATRRHDPSAGAERMGGRQTQAERDAIFIPKRVCGPTRGIFFGNQWASIPSISGMHD